VNWRAIRAINRKDLRVVRRSRALIVPLVLVPVLLMVVLPVVLTVIPQMVGFDTLARDDLQRLISVMPESLRARFASYTAPQAWVALVNTQLLGPLVLLVPFMVASVLAADSFAGERERRTLEALLHAPVTDAELLVAKLLGSLVPAVAIAIGGSLCYALVVNIAAWPVMRRVFFPDATWVVMILWVAPAFALLALVTVLLVSLRVRTTQEAMQLSGLLVLPIVALIVGQVRGVVLLGPGLVLAVGAVSWIADGLLLLAAVRRFRRTTLIARV
jgi:ABC-type Na+ efflux pump permease subunit